jgi:hypothetical protein
MRLKQFFTFERTALLCSAIITLGAFALLPYLPYASTNESSHQPSMMDLAGRYYAGYSMARR